MISKRTTVEFRDLVHSAMRKQARDHSVGYAAALLVREQALDIQEAHLISRAAQVYARMLRREAAQGHRGKVQWIA